VTLLRTLPRIPHPGQGTPYPEARVRDMASWVRQHHRMEFIAYFSGRSGWLERWRLAASAASLGWGMGSGRLHPRWRACLVRGGEVLGYWGVGFN
jgi:hypothetical protein